MKKLIIVLLLLFSTIPFVNLRAEVVTASYDLTYTHGYWYDLNDGSYEANPNFSVTNRNKILYGSIILETIDDFHHLLYFDKNLKMIGYMNTALTEIETALFIDNITSFTPDIPSNAVYFALMGFYPYLNDTPIPEINNFTLGQVFGGTYDLDDTFNVLSSSSFLDLDIAELNNHTLREVFEGGNLLVNGDFNNTSTWMYVSSTGSISSGIASLTATSTNGRLRQTITRTINEKYYIVSNFKSNSNLVGISSQTGVQKFHSGSNLFETNSFVLTSTSTTAWELAIQDNRTSNWSTIEVNYFYTYNMTSLGISSLTVAQMDYWFNVYQSIKTGNTQFPTGYVNSGTGYVFYSNTTTNVLLTVNVFSNNILDYPMYSPIYGETFDELSGTQQSNQLSTWSNNTWQLLDFNDISWTPTQTQLTDFYTLFQNNITFDDFYFDDVELTVSQPQVSYTYNRDVDNRGIVDYINDLLDDIGLGSSMAKFSISLILIVIVMVILWLVKAPSLLIIMGGLLMLIMFIIFGWIPIYIIVIVSAVLFYLIATNKGGNQDA